MTSWRSPTRRGAPHRGRRSNLNPEDGKRPRYVHRQELTGRVPWPRFRVPWLRLRSHVPFDGRHAYASAGMAPGAYASISPGRPTHSRLAIRSDGEIVFIVFPFSSEILTDS
jgi:hypothetical protein